MTKITSSVSDALWGPTASGGAQATNGSGKVKENNGAGNDKKTVEPPPPAAVVTLSPVAVDAMAAHNRTKALAAERDALRRSELEAKAAAPRPAFKLHVKDETAAVNTLKALDARVQGDFRDLRDTYKASEAGQAFKQPEKDDPFAPPSSSEASADKPDPFAPSEDDPFAPGESSDPFAAPTWSDPSVTSYARGMDDSGLGTRFSTYA